ncbi:MAG: asparaginase domain-containing protein, partial [Pseudolabrys sp.]
MRESASRRRVLKNMAALGAAGAVSTPLATAAQYPLQLAQAQSGAQGRASGGAATGALPRIQLLIGPGTLPSVGKNRMDLLRYRVSGIPRLTGQQLLEPLPEIASIARVEVDNGNPWNMATYEDLRKLSMQVGELLRSPDVDGIVWVQGTNTIEETAYFLSLTVRSEKPIVITGAQR